MGAPSQPEHLHPVEKRTVVTFLFSDVVASLALKQQVGAVPAQKLMSHHHEIIRSVLREFPDGREIQVAGDGFLIGFSLPSEAVLFALRVQSRVRTEMSEVAIRAMGFLSESSKLPAGGSEGPLSVRDKIGIYLGEVLAPADSSKPTEYVSTVLDCAHRITSLAKGDQILCSRPVFDNARYILRGHQLKGLGKLAWIRHGNYLLTGTTEPVEICEVGEEGGGKAVLKSPPPGPAGVPADEKYETGWWPEAGKEVPPNTGWILKRKLGEGGFGQTWRAEKGDGGQTRAFKFCFKVDHIASLVREKALFDLITERTGEHSELVRVYDVYTDGPPYYVEMEYVEGPNLDQWLQSEQQAGRVVTLATKLEIVAQVADALAAAHPNIVHNDVKPSNILMCLGKKGDKKPFTVKLSDFGIGRILAPDMIEKARSIGLRGLTIDPAKLSETSTTLYGGTPTRIAPELLEGKPPTPQSDFYALGVLLYQLYISAMRKAVPTDWQWRVHDPIIRADLRRLLAGEPEHRPANGTEIAQGLRRYQARRRLRRALSFAIVTAGVVALIIASVFGYRSAMQRLEERAALRQSQYVANISYANARIADGAFDHALKQLELCPKDLRNWEWRRLKWLCQSDLKLLKGHSSWVCSVAIDPTGRFIASASSDATVRIWDGHKLAELRVLRGHTARVWCLAFSPDGQRLASGSIDKAVRIWDVRKGGELVKLENHPDSVRSLAFSPDGKRLAVGCNDGTAKIWDAQDGKQLRSIDTDLGQLYFIGFILGGKRLLTAGNRADAIKVFDAEGDSAQPVLSYADKPGPGATARVTRVVLAPDEKRLVFGTGDGAVRVFDLALGKDVLPPLKGHLGSIMGLTVSRDGRRIASSGEDGALIIWNANDGRLLSAHNLGALGLAGPVFSLAFTPDNGRIAFGMMDGVVRILGVWSTRCRMLPLRAHSEPINAFALHPSEPVLASASSDKTIKLWRFEGDEEGSLREANTLSGHDKDVYCVAFNTDGSRIVSGGGDRTVRIWDRRTGSQIACLEGHKGWVSCVAFSPDGTRIASGSHDARLKIWDVHTEKELFTLEGHSQPITALAFSRDGLRLVSSSGNFSQLEEPGELIVWDLEKAQKLRQFVGDPKRDTGHSGCILSCAFSGDGKRVVSGGWDKTAKIWEVETGKEAATFSGHWAPVWCVTFSPDRKGSRVVSGAADGAVKIWDAQGGDELLSLKGHRIPQSSEKSDQPGDQAASPLHPSVVNVIFQNHSHLLSASADGAVMIWEAEPSH